MVLLDYIYLGHFSPFDFSSFYKMQSRILNLDREAIMDNADMLGGCGRGICRVMCKK